jgi:sigma-E factor negative regulatory protein RseA
MNEELDSQLSAMFDDALPSEECELLARRLSRDDALKARWGRYAVIGAAIRAERGVRLNAALAGRVNAAILAEPELGSSVAVPAARRGGARLWQGLTGAALAAGVAAVAVVWLRAQAPLAVTSAQAVPGPAAATLTADAHAVNATHRPESYVTPPAAAPAARPMVVPTTELANYVVAHSMVSSPMARRNLLSAFMTSDPNTAGFDEPQDDAKSNAH